MSRPDRLPRPGDVLLLGRAASVQFATAPTRFRVIGVDSRPTYQGWIWLSGYQLDQRGEEVAKREVFVQITGITVLVRAARRSDRSAGSGYATGGG